MNASSLLPFGLPTPGQSAEPVSHATAMSTLRALIGFSLGLLLCFGAASVLDTRELGGANVWLKPAKFALSFVVLYATLAWVVQRLSAATQASRAMKVTLSAMVLATWTEMAYIAGRAGLGVHSHFAVGTPLEGLLYSLMGVGAVSLVVGIAVIGWLVGRDPAARLGPALRQGVLWGFGLSALLTLITAGYLSSNGGHFVGVPSAGAAVLPGFGWSGEVGDLRPAHFLALHAMQVMPMLGWWWDRQAQSGNGRMRAFASVYALATLAVFGQAVMGLPLIRL
jgi:hypothetical protein